MTTGADSALQSLTSIAEKKDALAKGTNITLTLDDADLTEEKLNLIGDRVKELTAEGANVRVNLIGAGEAETQLGVLTEEQGKLAASGASVSASFKDQTVASESFGAKASKALSYAALGVAAVGAVSVKMAGDFDQSTTRLVTGAGESASKLDMVRQGILGISAATATSASELSTAMYIIESAGYHGAAGLDVLKASSEGARAEGANLTDVANAVTSALNSYHLPASDAVMVTDELVKSVGEGKMTMEQLAGSIHSVLPVAAAAGISLAQVGGAVATMTMQGMSAQQATQDLAHTIQSLQNPNAVAVGEMEQLGLKANDVAKNVGKVGLTGSISELEQAILKNMGPSGEVLLNTFYKSQDAAKDLNIMLTAMPAPVEKLAKEFMAGTLSLSAFHKAVPTDDAGMVKQFTTLYNKVHGFNTVLRAGGPASQTFSAALSKIMGGQTGLNTALMVGGANMSTFQSNVAGVSESAKTAGKDVENWGLIQSNFNFKMAQTKQSAEAVAISFGNDLMPTVQAILKPLAAFGVFLANNAIASKTFAIALVTILSVALGTKLVQGFSAVAEAGAKVVGLFTTSAAAATADAAATDTATVATKGFMLALLTNPITLIILAVVALGVGLYELTQHCAAFRDFWKDVWADIKTVADDVWGWLKSNWQLVVAALLTIVTGGMSLIAYEIYKNWHTIEQYTDDLRNDLASIWDTIWNNTIGRVIRGYDDTVSWFDNFRHSTANVVDGLKSDLVNIWNSIWNNTIGRIIRGYDDSISWFDNFRHSTANVFDGLKNDFIGIWDSIWNDTIGNVIRGIGVIEGWFRTIPSRVIHAVGDVSHLLVSAGSDMINGLWNGMWSVLVDAGNWVKTHLYDPIVNAIKGLFGIHSPSTVMADIGSHLVSGLVLGLLQSNPTAIIQDMFGSIPSALGSLVEKGIVTLTTLPAKAVSALAGLGSKLLSFLGIGGSGAAANVQGWIDSALAVTGKPLSWLNPLETLVGKESGGNPTAVNSIAVGGEHATGLLQMLPTTFAMYAMPGFNDILNPLDNAVASIRYISAMYGSPMSIPGLSGGKYVGYDQGGILNPGFHLVANLSGRPEQVIPAGGTAGGAAVTVNVYAHPSNNPDEVAREVWQQLRVLRTHMGNQPLGLG